MHHMADPLDDLLAHTGHIPVNLLLHHHPDDDHHLQIVLLASSAGIELVSLSARVTSANSHQKLLYNVHVQCKMYNVDTKRHPDP